VVHEMLYVHNDIKPWNIVVNDSDDVTLIDFESACLVGSEVKGYTHRYCALPVQNAVLTDGKIWAHFSHDWESLLYTVMSELKPSYLIDPYMKETMLTEALNSDWLDPGKLPAGEDTAELYGLVAEIRQKIQY